VLLTYIDRDHLTLRPETHVILLSGVAILKNAAQTQIAIYKDPDLPQLYLGIDFTVLLANRNVQAGPHNVFYLPCGDATTCSHTKAAKIYTGTFS